MEQAQVPNLIFPRGEHYAFFYEDTHLLMLVFERDARRYLFLVRETDGATVELDFPGDLYESQVRDAVDRIFFVELQEEEESAKRLVLGACFPVADVWYGAFYERGGDERALFFLRVIGSGELAALEAVEATEEHERVATAFYDRYRDVLALT
ncbi:MAG: hypothetical protein OWT28_12165 [Firmicutes bacterium]|nr:hypothetical protein [Bacillota bacterium]